MSTRSYVNRASGPLLDTPDVELPSAQRPAAARVQRAALDLFYERGYRSTSVRDIMAACNLTSGAFYNHFTSKDALLYQIARSTHDVCDHYLYRALAVAQSEPRSQVWHLARAIAEFHAVHAKAAHVTSQDFRELPEPALSDIRQRRRHVRDVFEHVIAEGVAAGAFESPRLGGKRSARLLATAITNMAIRISEWYSPDQGLSVAEIAVLHADLALRMTRSNGESEFAAC